MDALQLLACSMQAITEVEADAKMLVIVSIGLAAFAVLVSWMRPPAFLGTGAIIGMLALHPGLWISAARGDCGEAVRLYSTGWTVAIAVCGIVVIGYSRWRPPEDS
jgi:hypothetical protein